MPDLDHDALMKIAEAATPGDLDTAEDHQESDHYECPACGGDGEVDGETFANWDGLATGVQFFGVGVAFENYERFFRAFPPAMIRSLLTERLADKARIAELEGDMLRSESYRVRRAKASAKAMWDRATSAEASLAAKDAKVVLVPREPTIEMIRAGVVASSRQLNVYHAMLSAAPSISPSDEVVERMARAIFDAEHDTISPEVRDAAWASTNHDFKTRRRQYARAALQVLIASTGEASDGLLRDENGAPIGYRDQTGNGHDMLWPKDPDK